MGSLEGRLGSGHTRTPPPPAGKRDRDMRTHLHSPAAQWTLHHFLRPCRANPRAFFKGGLIGGGWVGLGGGGGWGGWTPPPLCDIPSGCCSFTGPWTVSRSSLRMLRQVAAFCRPLRPVLLLVSFPRSRSPVVGVLGLCWMWHGVSFAPAAPNNWRIEDVLVVAGVV